MYNFPVYLDRDNKFSLVDGELKVVVDNHEICVFIIITCFILTCNDCQCQVCLYMESDSSSNKEIVMIHEIIGSLSI